MSPDPRFLLGYCERAGAAGFWAEPLNAVSNAGFLLAAGLALGLWLRQANRDGALLALASIVGAIGMGSFLFHTIPNRITVLMDVVPIQAFILGYFGIATRRFLRLPIWSSLLAPVLFFAASAAFVSGAGNRAMGGGAGYLPALAALFGFAILCLRQRDAQGRLIAGWLGAAGAVFAISLTLRTLDLPACRLVPFGLHFLWHLLNASVLGLLLLGLERHGGSTVAREA
ncbi:hypothetical protein MCEMSEM23_01075 [Rhabdaerophilaceae bacterium]